MSLESKAAVPSKEFFRLSILVKGEDASPSPSPWEILLNILDSAEVVGVTRSVGRNGNPFVSVDGMGCARFIDSDLGMGLGPCKEADRVREWELEDLIEA